MDSTSVLDLVLSENLVPKSPENPAGQTIETSRTGARLAPEVSSLDSLQFLSTPLPAGFPAAALCLPSSRSLSNLNLLARYV